MSFLRALRSLLAVVACLFLLGVIAPLSLYLFVVPWTALRPQLGNQLGLAWVAWVARSLVFLCRLGGATISIEGEIDCKEPGVVIMNHQSVLEIAPLIYVFKTRLPRFVARARYAVWIPTVSRAIRYLDCIVIDPRTDRTGAILAMQKAARAGLQHPVMLFPEGHRTQDGEIAPFRPAGTIALLQEGPMPVWTIVSDGFWRFRKTTDTFFGLGSVKARIVVVDRKVSPTDPLHIPTFVEERRQTMIRELARLRAEGAS